MIGTPSTEYSSLHPARFTRPSLSSSRKRISSEPFKILTSTLCRCSRACHGPTNPTIQFSKRSLPSLLACWMGKTSRSSSVRPTFPNSWRGIRRCWKNFSTHLQAREGKKWVQCLSCGRGSYLTTMFLSPPQGNTSKWGVEVYSTAKFLQNGLTWDEIRRILYCKRQPPGIPLLWTAEDGPKNIDETAGNWMIWSLMATDRWWSLIADDHWSLMVRYCSSQVICQ